MLILLLLVGWGCDRFPQDPRHTLEHIRERGTLRVGVVDGCPWVAGSTSGAPGGLEGMLLAELADELGVSAEWHWGRANEHFETLARYELDVVIGGFTASNPWSKHVGFTLPYYTGHTIVGVPPGAPQVNDLDGVTVAARPGSGLPSLLRDRGAEVIVRDTLRGIDHAVAAEAWEIEGLGFRPTEIRLRKHPHVMAVPPGENAWLMHLEDFLLRRTSESRVADLLRDVSCQ